MSSETIEIEQNETEVTIENAKSFLPRLPLSKAKKIAKMDSEYLLTANAAMVATTFATELFVQSLVESALAMNQLNRNNKNKTDPQKVKSARLTYNDLAESVLRKECFQFLEDVIPKVQPQSNSKKNVQTVNKSMPTKNEEENEEENNITNDDDDEPPQEPRANTTAEINEQNTTNKQHTLSFFKKYQYNSNDKEVDTRTENIEEEEQENDIEMLDAFPINQDEDEDEDEDENVEEHSAVDSELQKHLSQVEQLDHVVDVDDETDKASRMKERMALNRNQEDNNDELNSSDSESDTDLISK
ncbi:some similarities with Saccharomyces cerevisiae YJL065C DLS1 Subunit of ISW2/yCHRAC chromatin accessibility complex along with Itc1p, Isw2p, and Dpb4p [Maudiozyma barnettii]|uniref:Some similarities with Saccharomyces cerevisiae YJL065C DLS1 Subunit of ISW2/yCHRAC chromatin accessibility complex along with Itc1p, Isw2p, and Dpb4p n=1 Tax=Maudiozyma barnettii TaxID=61262 RepID=A0A8H2ZHA5_9SACH|nr:uncharacterized protein KABA2_04S09020 [Kazachstania barnettii]CAB4254558.1 some similarities with Saccharomyces cerevisiae YJL065C DLS1 Subunit of ISW2/yCHRAC chromatin accessibility complex along with Itc1p, Isw2p, and Dpb4p [Kazachstania barnettii]CAD1782600.1 some similarities with Saccharomyces cerevisiae YJL065C DLS1 Subunit of ISW2/yCHRAC chromatin accessibility complex along with Itc1p, Isw2p, and Dpb4p [Kazachstania barnettii]